MKLSVNSTIQVLAVIAQYVNLATPLVPTEYHSYVGAALAGIQGVVGVLAHFSNTNGTPQAVPFVKGQ